LQGLVQVEPLTYQFMPSQAQVQVPVQTPGGGVVVVG
jgi:hypothetical protein